MLERFVAVPRWLLLATLVYAPWAYGCTVNWTIDILNMLMFVTTALWLLGCALRRKPPAVNRLCLACVLFILVQGWVSALNAQYQCNPDTLEFSPIPCFWKVLPGTVDSTLSLPMIFRFTGLLGILCFVTDLSQRPQWRMRLWWAAAGAGTSIVLLGLAERITQAPQIFWQPVLDGKYVWEYFFATYFYHANAGAYINLILPLVAGLVILAFRKANAHRDQTLWVPSLFVCIASAFVNVSKAGLALAVLLLAAIGVWQFREWRKHSAPLSKKTLAIYSVLTAMGLLAVFSVGWVVAGPRMMGTIRDLSTTNERILVERTCLRIIPDAGLCGFGPGTFSDVFPHYTAYLGDAITGFWKYAHEDYLQAVIEWGWVGAPVLGIIFFGGIVTAFRNYAKRTDLASRDRILLFTTGIALAVVALHSLVDFPLQIASLQFYTAAYLGLVWGSGQWLGKITAPGASSV